jgi:DNA-binding SARP family transcriptional activator
LIGRLMLALYRSGCHADALDVYRHRRRALQDELGLEPGPDLRALEPPSRPTPRSSPPV